MSERVLVVDDDAPFREDFATRWRKAGYDCASAPDGESALSLLHRRPIDVVFSDIEMPGMNGIELLKRIGESSPDTFTIMMTSYERYETAVDAMRLGAFDYISKPVNFEYVMVRIRGLLEHKDRLSELGRLRRVVWPEFDLRKIVGRTRAMERVFSLVRKVAPTRSTVLITGESGTGKELVARAVHSASGRTCGHRFVPVNCAALPENLLESELFGHVKGSFTGAASDKKGLFEHAGDGSIFLDEIGEMSPLLQAKLLRAIQEREIVPVGALDPVKIRARVICSTNRDLRKMVDEGRFREDLYYRINVVNIHLPPLRDRLSDVPHLIEHFVQKHNRELDLSCAGVAHDAMESLLAYGWKGNVRELENVIERAMILGDGRRIRMEDLPPEISGGAPPAGTYDLREASRAFEARHILKVLKVTGGNKEEAARLMGIALSSLYRKVEELGNRR